MNHSRAKIIDCQDSLTTIYLSARFYASIHFEALAKIKNHLIGFFTHEIIDSLCTCVKLKRYQ